MAGDHGSRLLNTDPSRFEELAGVIAAAYASYKEGRGLETRQVGFGSIDTQALDPLPCYTTAPHPREH
jgi:hypothetical protein